MNQPAVSNPPVSRDKWLRILGYAATGGYLILAVLTLAWGAYKRFDIPQVPTVDPDVRGYLGPALLALTGKGFAHLGGRSFPYPMFVFIVLRLFGNFHAIPVVQHILGVAAGGVTLLAWNALVRLAPAGGLPRQLSRYIGLAPAAIYLGSVTAIRFELQIRPEAIFPFFTILNLYISFLFIDARFLRRHSSAIWLGGLNVFVAALIYLLKPSFGLATLFSTAPVWLSLALPGPDPLQKGKLLALAILPAALLLFLPEQILKRNDVWSQEFVPETLFTIHASMIEDQMSRDLAANAPLPYSRSIVQSAHDLLATDIPAAASTADLKPFPLLGYDPQYLMYNSFCVEFAKMTGWTPAALDKFYLFYYRRTALKQPSAMLHKIIQQMGIFYTAKNPVYRLAQTLDISDEYAATPDLITKSIPFGVSYPPLAPYFQECQSLGSSGIELEQVKRFSERTRVLSIHYLDLLVVALVSPLLLIFSPLRRHLLWLVVALWLAYSYNFGNCLTIAVVHSLELTRYIRIQLIYTVFAQCAAIYFLIETIAYGVRLVLGRRSANYLSAGSRG
jgi:hypothetical protein